MSRSLFSLSLYTWRRKVARPPRPLPDNAHLTPPALDHLRLFLNEVHRRLKDRTGRGIPGTTTRGALVDMAHRAADFAHDRLPWFESLDGIKACCGHARATAYANVVRGECLGVLHVYKRRTAPAAAAAAAGEAGGPGRRQPSNCYRFVALPRPGTADWEARVERTVGRFAWLMQALRAAVAERGGAVRKRLRQFKFALGVSAREKALPQEGQRPKAARAAPDDAPPAAAPDPEAARQALRRRAEEVSRRAAEEWRERQTARYRSREPG